MAEKLFISDKAVSKWETGVSIPDTTLLIPMADLFGVTVTEPLMCQHMEPSKSLDAEMVENVVKTAISYSDEKPIRAYQVKNKWGLIYTISLLIACEELRITVQNGSLWNKISTQLTLRTDVTK